MVLFDPNIHDNDWRACLIPQARSFDAWISAWAEGVDLWKEMYGDDTDD